MHEVHPPHAHYVARTSPTACEVYCGRHAFTRGTAASPPPWRTWRPHGQSARCKLRRPRAWSRFACKLFLAQALPSEGTQVRGRFRFAPCSATFSPCHVRAEQGMCDGEPGESVQAAKDAVQAVSGAR